MAYKVYLRFPVVFRKTEVVEPRLESHTFKSNIIPK